MGIIDDKWVAEPQPVCSTIASPCNFLEDIPNMHLIIREVIKIVHGLAGNWIATAARTDQS